MESQRSKLNMQHTLVKPYVNYTYYHEKLCVNFYNIPEGAELVTLFLSFGIDKWKPRMNLKLPNTSVVFSNVEPGRNYTLYYRVLNAYGKNMYSIDDESQVIKEKPFVILKPKVSKSETTWMSSPCFGACGMSTDDPTIQPTLQETDINYNALITVLAVVCMTVLLTIVTVFSRKRGCLITPKQDVLVIYCPEQWEHNNVVSCFVSFLRRFTDPNLFHITDFLENKSQDWLVTNIQTAKSVIVIESEGLSKCYSAYTQYMKYNKFDWNIQEMIGKTLDFLQEYNSVFEKKKFIQSISFDYSNNSFRLDMLYDEKNYFHYNLSENFGKNTSKMKLKIIKKFLVDLTGQDLTKEPSENLWNNWKNSKEIGNLREAVSKVVQYKTTNPNWFHEMFGQLVSNGKEASIFGQTLLLQSTSSDDLHSLAKYRNKLDTNNKCKIHHQGSESGMYFHCGDAYHNQTDFPGYEHDNFSTLYFDVSDKEQYSMYSKQQAPTDDFQICMNPLVPYSNSNTNSQHHQQQQQQTSDARLKYAVCNLNQLQLPHTKSNIDGFNSKPSLHSCASGMKHHDSNMVFAWLDGESYIAPDPVNSECSESIDDMLDKMNAINNRSEHV